MPPTYTAKRISPMLATANMEKTIAFFRDILGFTVTMQAPNYSIIERDNQSIHLQNAAKEEIMKLVRDHTEIYIEVSVSTPSGNTS